jgi:hypothetical protein
MQNTPESKSPELTVELVPITVWGDNLSERLRLKEWGRLRHVSYEQAGHPPEICGGTGKNGRTSGAELGP